MPSVVPATTCHSGSYWAASTTVATWVLSPISTMKKATRVARKGPKRGALASSSSSLSGTRAQAATARKDSATPQRSHCGSTQPDTSAPSQPASAWLRMVATRMPATMGQGLR